MENEIIVESTKDKIRRSPEIIFDYKDIRGVENAFRSMLEIFTAEALRGHGNEIEVFRFNDSTYAIRLRSDRCLNLGKIGCGDEAWRALFTEFCTDYQNYNELLFGSEESESAEPAFDRVDDYPFLACNQFVTEFMTVRARSGSDEKAKLIEFRHGGLEKALYEGDADFVGTQIFFKYDSNVFDDITLSDNFFDALLHEASLANKGIKYTLKEAVENYRCVLPTAVYYYEDAADYISEASGGELLFPVIECRRKHVGSDGSIDRRSYTAVVDVSVGVTKDASAVNCFYNGHRLSCGGEFLREFYKVLQGRLRFVAEKNRRFVPITVRQLKKHLVVNIDIRTIGCIPYWGDAGRRSLDNRMITELVLDICRNEIISRLFADEGAVVERLVDLIGEEDKCERGTNTFRQTLENAVADYENGDGKGEFVDCLVTAPRKEEGCAALISVMHREACKKEPLYYYVLLTDFAEYMTADVYNRLGNYYRSNIGEHMPELFKADGKSGKLV